jgi:hypothetical protein
MTGNKILFIKDSIQLSIKILNGFGKLFINLINNSYQIFSDIVQVLQELQLRDLSKINI